MQENGNAVTENAIADAISEAAGQLDGILDVNNELLREDLRAVLHTTGMYFMDDTLQALTGAQPGLGTPNLTDALWHMGNGLHAIAEAIRGDARPVVRHEHVRAPREPEPEGGPEPIDIADRRKRAS